MFKHQPGTLPSKGGGKNYAWKFPTPHTTGSAFPRRTRTSPEATLLLPRYLVTSHQHAQSWKISPITQPPAPMEINMRIQYQYPGELLLSRATSKDITVHLRVLPIEQETHRFRTNGFETSSLGRALLEITHTVRITHPTPCRRHPKP